MPLYDIEHVIPLTSSEQSAIAVAFTNAHARRFHTPRYFINVGFTDASAQPVYRGGVLRLFNRAVLRVRAGESRTADVFQEHCRDLMAAWDRIVGKGKDKQGRELELRNLWVMAALTTGMEGGFARPTAGGEVAWLKRHLKDFEKAAEEGDEEMAELMMELNERDDFQGVWE